MVRWEDCEGSVMRRKDGKERKNGEGWVNEKGCSLGLGKRLARR